MLPKANKTVPQYILGISASCGESSVALLRDGKNVFAAAEAGVAWDNTGYAFPSSVVNAALERASELENDIVGIKDLAAVAFHKKPQLKYDRLRKAWDASVPGGLSDFLNSAPAGFVEKKLGDGLLKKELAAVSWGEKAGLLLFPEHQLCLAAGMFYPSTFDDAAILVIDGEGEWSAAAICLGSGEKMKILKEIRFPHSPALLYSALTGYAGFEESPNAGPASAQALKYRDLILKELVELKEDGSLRLNESYFSVAGMHVNEARWTELFGLAPHTSGGGTARAYADFAASARLVVEDIVFKLGAQAKRLTGSNNLCFFGEAAFTHAVGGKLKASGIFSRLSTNMENRKPWVEALGAALTAHHIYFGVRRSPMKKGPVPEAAATRDEKHWLLEDVGKKGRNKFSALLYTAIYYLVITPAVLAQKLLRKGAPPNLKKPETEVSFYNTRNHLYSREDLLHPF